MSLHVYIFLTLIYRHFSHRKAVHILLCRIFQQSSDSLLVIFKLAHKYFYFNLPAHKKVLLRWKMPQYSKPLKTYNIIIIIILIIILVIIEIIIIIVIIYITIN